MGELLKAQQRLTAQVSQQRAQARAAEFKKRAQAQREQEAQLRHEELERDRQKAEALLAMRQHKRHLPVSDAPPPFSRQASVMSASCDDLYASHEGSRAPTTELLETDVAAPLGGQACSSSSQRAKPAVGLRDGRAVKPPFASKPPKVPGAHSIADTSAARAVDHNHSEAVPSSMQMVDCPTAAVGENGSVRCVVGFFGLGDHDVESQADTDRADEQPQEEEQAKARHARRAAPTPPPRNKLQTVRRSTPDAPSPQRQVVQIPPSRSSSQPPPARSKSGQPQLARVPGRQKSTQDAPEKHLKRMRAAVSEPPPVSSASTRAVTPSTSEHDFDTPEPPRCPSEVDYSSIEAQPCKSAPRTTPWKQKPVQVNSAKYYLEMLKQARGGCEVQIPPKSSAGKLAEQIRQRAVDVEINQHRAAEKVEERGYAVLQRVQNRALQVAQPRAVVRES